MRLLLVAVICIFSVCCRSLAFLTSTPGFVPLLLLSQLITVNTLPVNMCSLKPKIVVGKPNCFDSIFGLPRRDLLSGAAAVGASFASSLASEAAEPDVGAAIRSFNQGQYEDSLKEWSALTTSKPSVGLYWSNRGTIELILGSKQASLGVAPTGEARELLEASVSSLERAVSLDKVDDTLTLNNLGNAQAVLLQWEAAGASYDRALAAAQARDRSIASIPASNRAQVSVELGDLEDAEKRVVSLLRKDPNFVDGRALLAAIKYKRGDKIGAEAAYADICEPAISAPNGSRQGVGGVNWCKLYSTPDVVMGRWTAATIAAYTDFLGSLRREGASPG